MTNPYTAPIPPAPRPPDTRPLRKRVLVWVGGVALFVVGVGIGATGEDGQQPAGDEAKPATTVTATRTATPEPAPTVTETVKAKAKAKPRPTVTVTRSAAAKAADDGDAGSGGSSGDTGGQDSSGTCSIVSSAGNCYSAGQFCRNSDHGATTSTASGRTIKCASRSGSWRWTYS
ncbi:hypothetical protein AN217_04115 [Streptomyces qinglanensis]|uniref:Uncharacterized protein n=1 Tax=Streptomyces qinglanensis TaxID=943816 RepID=A0A1E7KAG6_9ACTN|nr:hypothetical protein [Streptomyces qinglanensis]OEV00935.1 hypothetical protein AN217_04115 [Streptomyces qinglanensis]OEV07069.1 hypothetical protein AN220_35250 [Streptomyces nanshensis]